MRGVDQARRLWWIVVGLVLLIAGTVLTQLHKSRVPALTQILRSFRPFELLLANQPELACEPDGGIDADSTRSFRCKRPPNLARSLARVRLARASEPDSPDVLGRLDLIFAGEDTAAIERAVRHLEAAIERDSSFSNVNDLAVAYAVRGAILDHPGDILRALDLLLKVSERGEGGATLQHNRDVLLQRLRMTGTWIPATVGHQQLRERSAEQLLEIWADRWLATDTIGSDGALRQLGSVADSIGGRDQSVYQAVGLIRAADPITRTRLATGHRLHARALGAFLSGRSQAAEPDFVRATKQLDGTGDPYFWWATLGVAASAVYDRRPDDAERLADSVLLHTEVSRYPALHGRALWIKGLALGRAGDYAGALAHYQSAAMAYRHAGEATNLGSMHFLIAEVLALQGRSVEADRSLILAAEALAKDPYSRQHHDFLLYMGRYMLRRGFVHLSRHIHDRGLAVAWRTGRAKDPAEAMLRLAQTEIEAGNLDVARRHVERAAEIYRAVDDRGMAARGEADILDTSGSLWLSAKPADAVARFSAALDFFRAERSPSLIIRTLARRAAAYRAADSLGSAERDLREAIALHEYQIGQATTSAAAAAAREVASLAYKELIETQMVAGDTAGAFQAAARAVGARSAAKGPWFRLAQLLQPGDVHVRYAVLAHRTVSWILLPTSLRMVEAEITPAELEVHIDRFISALTLDDEREAIRWGTRLYDALLGSANELSRGGVKRLFIEADGPLARLPFSALRANGDGPFLIELTQLTIGSPGQPDAVTREPLSALVADATVFDRTVLPELPALSATAEEARRVFGAYERRVILDGSALTPKILAERLSQANVFHFAGHAWANPLAPELSALILMAGQDGRSTLSAAEIERLDLRQLKLAVLSGCSTAGRGSARSADVRGLAHAFLAAGAGEVIASIWDVPDDGTAQLLARFHELFAGHRDAAAALHVAQLELLRSDAPALRLPRIWAGFQRYTN